MRKMLECTILIVLGSMFAFAQNQTPAADDYKKIEFYAGYSANNLLDGNPQDVEDINSNSTPTYRGWNVSGVYNFNRYVGVKADFSGQYKKFTLVETPNRVRANASFYNYTAGIQVKDNKAAKRFSPFAHALFGAATSKIKIDLASFPGASSLSVSNTGFSMIFGGGLDIRITKRFSVRAIQADYNPTFIGGNNRNNVRLGFGIVFH